jgi:hypothetical protein
MAIVSMDELVDALANSGERIPIYRQAPSGSISVASPYSLWRTPTGMGGVATSNPPTGVGEACTKATPGAVPFTAPGGADSVYLAGVEMAMTDEGLFTVYDRLVHSGTTITSQAVNSAALPSRATGGANVEPWMEVYTAIGSTARTLTVTYTNQDGTSGRIGTVLSAVNMKAGEMRPIALQGGDTGVRSVESVIWSATTGTTGDFGITLLRRVASMAVFGLYGCAQADAFDLGLPLIDPNSCLAFQCDFDTFAARPLCGIVTFARG